MKVRLFVFVLIAAAGVVNAQKLTSSYGKATIDDLQMTQFDADTTASAVVLYQSGYLNGNTLEFTYFRRVKVLRKEGTGFAEFTFNADNDSYVRARTLNLENGKIAEDKAGKGNIFKQQITGGSWAYRIAMPNVREGSVIEIEYRMFLLPGSFRFQESIPVVRAELLLEENPQIEFRKTQVGYTTVRSTRNFFYADYVPAFKTESYTTSPENYITRFDFDLLRISVPGMSVSFTTEWEAVNKLLNEDTSFGRAIEGNPSFLNQKKEEIDAGNLSQFEKMVAAYESIKSVKWNGEERLFASVSGLRTRFNEGSANSSEINMMLCLLLRKLGITSNMVAMSTRDKGMLNPVYPSIQKLNYAIVYAQVDGKEYVLDATEKDLPFGLLPLRCLNQQGRLIEAGPGKWVDLTPQKPEKSVIKCELSINASDQFAGTITEEMEDYAAFDFRTRHRSFTSDDAFAESLEKERPGFAVKEFKISNLDKIYENCILTSNVTVGGKIQRAGDMLIVNPFLFGQITDNPFKPENRIYPVDFAYRRIREYNASITIPEGYSPERIPADGQFKTKDGGINVTISYLHDENIIRVVYNFEINKIQYLPDEYRFLRDVYNQLIAKQAEPIILKKNAKPGQ